MLPDRPSGCRGRGGRRVNPAGSVEAIRTEGQGMARSRRSAAGVFVEGLARLVCALSPRPLAAVEVRFFLSRCVRRGSGKLAARGAVARALASTAAPFTTVTLFVGRRDLVLELVPFAAWFRGSVLSRVLSRGQIADISGRFSQKAGLKVVLPSGLSVPLGAVPGAIVEVSGSLVEWLVDWLENPVVSGIGRSLWGEEAGPGRVGKRAGKKRGPGVAGRAGRRRE
jgi:hypothetical protein